MVLVCISSSSQNNEEILHTWKGAEQIMISESGKITIEGDTLVTIKGLLKVINTLQNEREEALNSVLKSVNWSNTVSDYWKNNKQWNEYLISIRKQGFKFDKKRKK